MPVIPLPLWDALHPRIVLGPERASGVDQENCRLSSRLSVKNQTIARFRRTFGMTRWAGLKVIGSGCALGRGRSSRGNGKLT
jgi:hypothetical protein